MATIAVTSSRGDSIMHALGSDAVQVNVESNFYALTAEPAIITTLTELHNAKRRWPHGQPVGSFADYMHGILADMVRIDVRPILEPEARRERT